MPLAITLMPQQREMLAQALADAVCYRDPPVCRSLPGVSASQVITDVLAPAARP